MHLQTQTLDRVSKKVVKPLTHDKSQSQNSQSFLSVLDLNIPAVTVLLIDDQVIIGEAIRRIMEPETDISLHFISEPTQAIQKAIEISPTVILLDLVMPEIDGLMLLRWFRVHPATQDIPIVMLSSQKESLVKADAFATGANDYLIKLPDSVELIARIRYHSRAYNNLKALTHTTTTAQLQAQQLENTLQELKAAQMQLVQTEKMSSLGRMLAGITHEINNPINFIHGNFQHLNNYIEYLLNLIKLYQKEYSHTSNDIEEYITENNLDFIIEDAPKILSSMKLGTERIREIVKSLRNFSRLDNSEKIAVNINDGIDSNLLILSHRYKGKIAVHKKYEDLPLVECYPAQLNQVFMNIISNAIDALLEQEEQENKHILIQTETIDEKYIRVIIQDNGPGIELENQSKIFEPFFTTKPVNKGTGIGLAISGQIIDKHQGKIFVKSEPAYGTEFIIEIPIKID
ncbi:ATP-binding protein [Chlorogloeopsis sp. ULAP01]|uniref:hybrid sensor histidine kinase/response regulator n=1 Tax=Chlorogloeopsis sp. ULAP01 TaxID=3056483 RepID=UPI0025AB0165|nr:ATP-binding protein [Chlorogloeopsis sp. ULAP01]MDM9384287.1 ATP-binding protein [Chlorogloeopsis sp. ULAP01]